MLTDGQRQKYESIRQTAKEELEQLDQEIMAELTEVKEKLQELQQARRAVKQVYDGACARLGIKSVIEIQDFSLADLDQEVKQSKQA
jgi:flagellar biosynthesis chaperone FliJ